MINEEIKEFAEKNFYEGNYDTRVGFEWKGTWIINPWIDSSGRFELTDEKAIETYGKENIEKFIKLAKKYFNK